MKSARTTVIEPPAYKAGKAAASPNGVHMDASDDKVNILIVDDRPEKLLALEACLSSLNQNLVRARSGNEALKCLLKEFAQQESLSEISRHFPRCREFVPLRNSLGNLVTNKFAEVGSSSNSRMLPFARGDQCTPKLPKLVVGVSQR